LVLTCSTIAWSDPEITISSQSSLENKTKKSFMDLRTILHGCQVKNPEHQKALYERFYDSVFRIAFRYTNNHGDAALFTNESFVSFFRDVRSFKFQKPGDLEAMVKDNLKRLVVYKVIDKLLPLSVNDKKSSCRYFQNTPTLVRVQSNENFYGKLISVLQSLPPWHQLLFNMHVIDGFSLTEIAAHFQTSVSACTVDLAQAKAFLRNSIYEKEPYLSSAQQVISVNRG
jgi:RNA polymerase sigma factor (sigma-70 family)